MSRNRIGKFTVLAELGTGAGSRVFHVRRAVDSQEFALKVVPVATKKQRKYLEQARHEFRVGSMLDHPNLVKVHAFETETDWLFRLRQARLLVEFAPGQTLDRLAPLKPLRLLHVFERVADSLAHMHSRGVFHADLKPTNLILDKGVGVKVIDYGLAWIEGEPKERLQGTPEYMAPETQLHKFINARTDIFNFGATLYRLATQRPLPTSQPGLVLDERSYNRSVIPAGRLNSNASTELCDIIHWCIEYNPERRPPRIAEVQVALAQLVSDGEASEAVS
jgi:eukaryotic-like serine/threonine-protein kinase